MPDQKVSADPSAAALSGPELIPAIQSLANVTTTPAQLATYVGTNLGISGSNTGDQTVTLTGDVTGSGTGSFAATIGAGAVTLAKQANLAANSIQGNNTGGAATPIALTVAQTKSLLAIANTDISGLGTLSTQSGTFSGTSSGTNTGDQTITLTGNVTGTGTGTFATTIAASAVTNAMLAGSIDLTAKVTGALPAANMPALTGDVTSSAGSVATTVVKIGGVAVGTLATQNGTFSGTSSGTNTGDQSFASPAALGGTTPAAVHATALTSVPTAAPTRDAGNVGFVLAQTGLPMILQSSGSIGNNGALTGLTALGTTYANAYMWFPTNTISAATAAGWYYVVMSSTTAGTIYNNTYSSGTPTVPVSPTAFSTTGPGAYTQATTIQTPITVSVPGNTMGVNGGLEIEILTTQNNTAGTKTMSPKFGGTTMGPLAVTTSTTSSFEHRIRNAGVTNVQTVHQRTSAAASAAISVTAPNRLAIDTTSAQNVTINLTLATATDYQVVESFSIKVFPN